MALKVFEQVAGAIKEGFKFLSQWTKGSEKRRMRTAIEAAESYIFTSEDTKLTTKRRKKLLRHYKKRFFAYNN